MPRTNAPLWEPTWRVFHAQQLSAGKRQIQHPTFCLFVSILLDALLRLQAVCLRGMGSIFHIGSQKIELYSLHIYFSYFEVNSVLRSMPPDESETVWVPACILWTPSGALLWLLQVELGEAPGQSDKRTWMGSKPSGSAPPTHSCFLSITIRFQNHPQPAVTTQTQLTTHSKVQHLDMLHKAPRICGSQENQKGCSYILLLSLAQKVHILLFLPLCALFSLRIYGYVRCGEHRTCSSVSWIPVDSAQPDFS